MAQGICLPSGFKDCKLQISFGKHTYTSDKPKVQKDGYCRWDQREVVTIPELYQQIKRFPTLFVKLLDKDGNPICFYRDSITEFMDPAAQVHWVQLEPDLAVGKVKKQFKAGMVSFRLVVRDIEKDGMIDFNKHPVFGQKINKRYNAHTLRVAIYQC